MEGDDLNEEKMDELLRLMRSVVPDTSDMSDAGRVGFVYRHNYDPAVQYEELDVVKFGMSLWTPKAATIGNSPPDQSQEGQENVEENDFWVMFLPGALGSDYVKKTDLSKAPTETEPGKPGISYPDGKTIFADENGMLTGATSGKELTQEEMDEQLASGDLEPGSVVFLTGEAEGTNGLAIIVDKELNENSVHAIRNSAVAKAINAANALIAENQRLIAETQALRATLESFGLSKICPVDVTDVTEANGMVLGAWEKNASVEGSLANNIIKSTINTHFIRIEANCSGVNDNVYVSDALYEIPDVVLNGYITSIVERAWPLDTWRNANVSILQTQIEQNKLRVAVCSKENARYEIAIRVLYFSG